MEYNDLSLYKVQTEQTSTYKMKMLPETNAYNKNKMLQNHHLKMI